MSSFIKLSTLEFPFHEGDIRLEYPEIDESLTGDTFPVPHSYAKVIVNDSPIPNGPYSVVYPLPPQQFDGVWYVNWSIRNMTDEEKDRRQIQNGLEGFSVERL
jgi:hypothetical protein